MVEIKKETRSEYQWIIIRYNSNNKVFLNHDLTKSNLELYKAARIFKNENSYKFIWVTNGNIMLRKDENSKVVIIESIEQLKN